MAKDLSPAKCILLTIHYASEGNIKALHSFTPTRLDALSPKLVLEILLTYLPESLDPSEYTTYVSEVASRLYLDVEREDIHVDLSPVNDIDEEQAKKRVKKLNLLDIQPPSFPPDAPPDLLTRFLCHRSYRIDSETGLLNLVPQLIEPFLKQNDYIRTWYISVVLPLTRLQLEYYPDDDVEAPSLSNFEKMEGKEGMDVLLRHVTGPQQNNQSGGSGVESEVARDLKGLVGPWMYGHTERKRRKLYRSRDDGTAEGLTRDMRRISLNGISSEHKTGHDWEHVFPWMVTQAREDFRSITQAIEDWDGPGDVDLGGFSPGNAGTYLDEDTQSKLESQYAQAVFASCYAVEADTEDTVQGAHGVLARLAALLDFIPPPDLATSVESLPKLERHAARLENSNTTADLEPNALLSSEHPLTTPRFETYMLLQMMVYSAYQFNGLGYPISLVNAAKLHFYAAPEEQLATLKKILHGLGNGGARKDDAQRTADRAKLMWLWNWGIDSDDDSATEGAGVLGKIPRQSFEEEMLRCFTETSAYQLAINLYLVSAQNYLPAQRIEEVVLEEAMEAYDGASNGNKTRGGVKKANDIISAFRPYFSESPRFQEAIALIAATHALSFYSLTLQHGVPFQPVSIRVSKDPIGLISKVLEQNPRSYTKVDDLVSISRNLVTAGLVGAESDSDGDGVNGQADLEIRRKDAERRVAFMAIEAALREDDFETAYSYIMNRLSPSSADIEAPKVERRPSGKHHFRMSSKESARSKAAASDDDVSWRAAFLAGRYRPASASPPSLRRLEQRTELLSLALLLAPVHQLTEILAAWRRCEEEMTSLQRAQQEAEEDFDNRAHKRQNASALPGNFTVQDEDEGMVLNQKRREMGRMTGKTGEGEAPVSMFDLTRSAAQAFSKNAFPLRGAAASSTGNASMEESVVSLGSETEADAQQRVRRRDMIANTVSGGLASGLGWVLGATPASQQQER
ncbi:uncharacterized protein LTR77_002452 [Saxophila tyrrhenica]|uniref:Sec39 domain-containing protein n=1 Tax=Saxophila tyrrhenica TaxID=1690608 RepID=A0AAV9PNA6_9PEZI|nr:hypothetical protein LTR77_002452 [Saxophila tyrrhenica]